ncbi:unnamed protein product [Camellia sinensis]
MHWPEADEVTRVLDLSDPGPTGDEGRRRICSRGCERPINVCLCDTIPSEAISTATQVVVLQHPHEHRHKLATVPLLSKCLLNFQTLIGRRLRLAHSPLLDSLYNAAIQNPNQPFRAIYLFPGIDSSPAVEISKWRSSLNDSYIGNYVLIAFDGTLKHAREMVHASLPFLSKFAIRVCLDYDVRIDGGTIFDSDLILRKEPFSGCMSTTEAVARALHVLEHNGVEIEDRLVEVLKAMVRFQASHLKPINPRPRLLKRGKEDEKKN